ncbi:MAG: DegV family protein [Eggerthellaceae bacterium]|nr:DegV family protein [Eggerthellaceae bacterium]
MSVRIVVDSAADLSSEYAAENGIAIVSLKTIFPDGEYVQGVNLSIDEFYEKLIESTEIPRTSQATPFDFAQVFEELTLAGDTAVVITLSSKLSGTYESACSAAAEYEGRVFVVDSLSVSVGEYLLVDRAIAMRAEGKSAREIAQALDVEKGEITVMAALDTLEYLKKGGRISSDVALAGSLLSIKPVIAAVDGEIALVGKARGSRQSNNLLRAKIFEAGGIDFERPVRLGYTGLSDSLLRKYMRDSEDLYADYHDGELPVTHIGSIIGTHTGPGAIALAFFGKQI